MKRCQTLALLAVAVLAPPVATAQEVGYARTVQRAKEAGPTSSSGVELSGGASEESSWMQTGQATEGAEAPAEEAGLPEMHQVKKGDTLWGICQQYFGDPWKWPMLWAENPLVTNPHWIFPGDVVRLGRAETDGTPKKPEPKKTDPNENRFDFGKGVISTAEPFRKLAIVESKTINELAQITGSREEKILLTTGDSVYIDFTAEAPLRAGERYSIVQQVSDKPLKHPGDPGRTLGYVVYVYGDVVIEQVTAENKARGTLMNLVGEIERGHRVARVIRQFEDIEPRTNTASMEAEVVAALDPVTVLGNGHFVLVDKGKTAGIDVGNRFKIVRRGDGHRPLSERMRQNDPEYPKEVVGELLVVDIRDDVSIAMVRKCSREIRIGDVAEMVRGY